ncbi:MAG: hypothetical protein K0S61_2835 [Anaerocolumna sp.]|nr:hypothetical protein [Anaerocolumna sp.]
MKCSNKKVIVIFIVIISFLSGCTSINNEEIVIEAGTFEFSYIEIIIGQETIYTKEIKSTSLEAILNDWISDLVQYEVNYGNTPKGSSIFEDLEVKDAYMKGSTLIIVLNEPFLYFDEMYSHPVYYLNGLGKILEQVTDATQYSIEVPGDKRSIIHPDGVMIKNIPLTTFEN